MNKNGIINLGLLLAIFLSTPFLGSMIIGVETADNIYERTEDVPAKEVGLIFGAAAYGDKLSDILKDRVDVGIELYKSKKVHELVMSGAANESAAMKKYAIENGVPEGSIKEDTTGLNTIFSLKHLSTLDHSVILVSQRYHLPRGLFIADQLGIEAVGITADKRDYLKILNFKTRELLAISKAVWDTLNWH